MATPADLSGTSGLSDTYGNDLETTTAALEGGVSSLAPSAALNVIDTWRDTLHNAESPDLNHIGNLLDELKDALQADRLDGRTIGSLMSRLGEQTTAAAAGADDARITPSLERLGALLSRAGTSLGSATDEDASAASDAVPPVSQTEKGLRPTADDDHPGKSTDRAQ